MNPRLRRLQADYEDMRECFSGHPHVTVEPLGTTLPPESYRITYKVTGLTLEGDQPVKRHVHNVKLTLPAKYPTVQPYVVPEEGEPIFHPNIANYFCLADKWWPSTKLTDIVIKMGDMIQWHEGATNPNSPLDPEAAKWAVANKDADFLPVGNVNLGLGGSDDSDMDVHGGEPSDLPPTSGGDEPTGAVAEPVDTTVLEDDFEVVVLNSSVGGT